MRDRYCPDFFKTYPQASGVELIGMVVRIRFRRGPRVERRKGKNTRVAWVAAGLMTLGSVSCLTLALWRLGVDFGWAGEFVFPNDSFLSHWQVWLLGSILIQISAWRLNRYGKPKTPAAEEDEKKQMTASA
jgi:hypothetical protein